MWRILSRNKKSIPIYANDWIAATGKLPLHAEFIRYRITPGVTSEFDRWLQEAYSEWHKQKASIALQHMPTHYFIHYGANEETLPMLGMIASSTDLSGRVYPFSVLRLLEHPLAKEFRTVIPLLYQQTFAAFDGLMKTSWQGKPMNVLQQTLDQLRECNSKITRRDALEAVIYQLNDITLGEMWREMKLTIDLSSFMAQVNVAIRQLKQGTIHGMRLPLPHRQDVLPSVVFWLQLLETCLDDRQSPWQVFWQNEGLHHRASLLFYNVALPAKHFLHCVDQMHATSDIIDVVQKLPENMAAQESVSKLAKDTHLSLIKLLPRWCEVV